MILCEYRQINQITDLEKIVDLEIAVWGLNPRDAAPSNLMHAMAHTGSLIVGAYYNEQLIGMALAFPTRKNGDWLLWSHMAAVHPDYQGQGIGFGIKQFQRTWALENGYRTIAWTFDPLQAGNAKFNLHHLGATSNLYHVNFYGDMTDELNVGLPSDRLEAHWNLRFHHQPSKKGRVTTEETPPTLLSSRNDQPILNLPLDDSQLSYFVEIPRNLAEIRQRDLKLALSWRLALREALQAAFDKGYQAVDFISEGQQCGYILRAEPWFLYVVECNDGSLYTGVTPTVAKRIKAHNRGNGAAYTKTRRPVKLIAVWQYKDRGSAQKAEYSFKHQSRQTKLDYIAKQRPYMDAPFISLDTE
jgi:predicted GNAT superfamily acetyltransferase